MTVTQWISGEADTAAARYGLLVDAWRALYSQALDQSHFGSPKQLNRLAGDAYTLARAYMEAERAHIESASSQIALEAQRVTLAELSVSDAEELEGAALEHLGASDEYAASELAIQVERDIAFLRHSVRNTYLNVEMSARAQGVPVRTALMQYRIGNSAELKFFFHDRRAGKWPSRKFVRSIWRHHLLAVYNETVLLTLADHGFETALISHSDAKAPPHGMEISINSTSELPTYAEIKEDIFHPNSEAILGKAP